MGRNTSISRWSGRGALIGAIAFMGAGAARAGVMNPVAGDPVVIDSGRVAGTQLDSGIRVYYGIPYAAPPVNELRWHAPALVTPWKGVYNADTPRPECVQKISSTRALNLHAEAEPVSEDCLYLDIWMPPTAKAGVKRPVMVYIHGGGFTGGSPNQPEYTGAEIAKKGIVYVTIGYRLGVFGYMAHPELTKESGRNASGNWGVLDQIAALEWVQRNIAAFGGDPANVTIVGHSAGSESVFTLQCSPLAHGLFAKASGWSGADLTPGGRPPESLAEAEASGVKVQQALNAKNLAEMRAAPWDRVLAALAQAALPATGAFGGLPMRPIIDGYSLPDLPETIFKQGKQNDVPLLASSTNADLGTNTQFAQIKTLADFEKAAREGFGDAADQFFKVFPAANDTAAAQQAQVVAANAGFGLANRDWARAQALSGKQPAYLVQFTRGQTIRTDLQWTGNAPQPVASHGNDIGFWLGSYVHQGGSTRNRVWTAWDRELSAKMEDVLATFAKTGNPGTDAVKVPRYDPNNEQRAVFGDTIFVDTLNTEQIEFLRTHPLARPQQAGGR